jgi:HPt (histidine-containing phosphotransfer) domain-containing protein
MAFRDLGVQTLTRKIREIPHPVTPIQKLDGSRRAPVDLDHLARQTLGNRDLQREVLRMFVSQCALQIDALKTSETLEERRHAAHTLVGAARGIGAFSVAYIASEIELSHAPVAGRIKALETAADVARKFIDEFLST